MVNVDQFISMYAGEPGFCIAGGPSVASFKQQLVHLRKRLGIPQIGVNRAAIVLDTQYMSVYDYGNVCRRWKLGAYGGVLFAPWLPPSDGRKITPESLCVRYNHAVVKLNPKSCGLMPSFRYGICSNGGAAGMAISIAWIMGINPIYLIGYDYTVNSDGKTFSHFYSDQKHDYDEQQMEDRKQQIEAIAGINGASARIINLSRLSELRQFERRPFQEVYEGLLR